MSRPLRINMEGGWYHITGRGNERRPIFWEDDDRQRFLDQLAEMVDRFACQLYAYVLMVNHYHLEMETQRANLSRAMQWLEGSYANRFNRRHRRVGHLFQARFGAVILDPAEGALEVSRYLHLNPVRVRQFGLSKVQRDRGRQRPRSREELKARLEALRNYRWSSYPAYVGWDREPAWLRSQDFLKRVGMDAMSYWRYVEEPLREGRLDTPWERLRGQLILGGAHFVDQLQDSLKGDRREQIALRAVKPALSWEEVVAVVEEIKREKWHQFCDRHGDWGRDLTLSLAWKRGDLTLRALAEKVGGVDYTTVGSAIHRFHDRCRRNPELAGILARAERKLPFAET
ncbi:MAG: transposase [Acidobacteriia bacterium]|nr:transposase [Terriglobia bacterium]